MPQEMADEGMREPSHAPSDYQALAHSAEATRDCSCRARGHFAIDEPAGA